MANRHLLRSVAMQTLFQVDVLNLWDSENLWEFVQDSLDRLSSNVEDTSYVKEVIAGVIEHKAEIDETITKYATGWVVDTIAPVERNTLRVAIYEMLFYKDSDIPHKVSINEAIEIAKFFSVPAAGKFVNGVLGGLYNTIKDKA